MTCGCCQLPIHESESGLRHFGFYTAHSGSRCVELLKINASERVALERERCAKIAEQGYRQEATGATEIRAVNVFIAHTARRIRSGE